MVPRKTMRRESGKVAVAGNPGTAFCDCKHCVLCVRNQLPGCRNEPAHFQDALQVIRPRDDHAALPPRADLFDCRDRNLSWAGCCVYPGVRDDSQEPDRDQHAQRDRPRSIHKIFKPAAMSRMGFFIGAMGVYEQIYVRHQQGSSSA